jgi:hypothetical protein
MTIAEARTYCKERLGRVPRDVVVVGLILLSSSASFGLGILAGREHPSTSSGQGAGFALSQPVEAAAAAAPRPAGGQVVASKNGTKYYLPSCSGASRISAANKVTFASASAAAAAGYTPAANCPSL